MSVAEDLKWHSRKAAELVREAEELHKLIRQHGLKNAAGDTMQDVHALTAMAQVHALIAIFPRQP